MKFGKVNKSTTVNRFVFHTLQRNITRLAVITRKSNIKLGILKGRNWKRAGVKAPTFSGTHVLRGLKLVIFQPFYRNGNGIKFWLVHVFRSKVCGYRFVYK